jgi:hypothetical protein
MMSEIAPEARSHFMGAMSQPRPGTSREKMSNASTSLLHGGCRVFRVAKFEKEERGVTR